MPITVHFSSQLLAQIISFTIHCQKKPISSLTIFPFLAFLPTRYLAVLPSNNFNFHLHYPLITRQMDDFLSDVTEEMVEARLRKMKDFLKQEQADILKKIQEQSEYIFSIKKAKSNYHNFDEVQKSYGLFQRACENILDTYFPLLSEDDFLSLQSEQQITEKMANLKAIIERNSSNLIRRLSRPREQLQKEKKIKKEHRRKGKNSKIALESTSIMQKWLLQNFHDPYPTQVKKQQMARESKLTVYQVNNWFINARERVIKRFLKKDLKDTQRSLSKSEEEEEES